MVAALGGPADLLERPAAHLPLPEVTLPVLPARSGYVAAQDVRAIGLAIVGLGGGRTRADQAIDHAVGFTRFAALGAEVGPERPLCLVHARDEAQARAAAAEVLAAVSIADEPLPAAPVILERLTKRDALPVPDR
jgi:thymidine phosphorylase